MNVMFFLIISKFFPLSRLISGKNYEALEDLVLLSKNVFGCDRDFMFLTWVKAVGHDAAKVRQDGRTASTLILA